VEAKRGKIICDKTIKTQRKKERRLGIKERKAECDKERQRKREKVKN